MSGFDYPYSDVIDLRELLTYLNEHSLIRPSWHQMLDLFGDGPLDRVRSTPTIRSQRKYPYYDISAVENMTMPSAARRTPRSRCTTGGVRKAVFGTENGLTKAALILASAEVVPFVGWHHTEHASIADFSCVLLHYPFIEHLLREGRGGRADRSISRVSASGSTRDTGRD